jgi:hypothetical protein
MSTGLSANVMIHGLDSLPERSNLCSKRRSILVELRTRRKLAVKPDENSCSEDAAQFRTTHWTVIMLAAQCKNSAGKTALVELYQLYWPPLYAFARYRGYSPQDAQDLTQG